MKANLQRIKNWRDLRSELSSLKEDEQLYSLIKYWSAMPISHHVLDYDNTKSWPTAWDLISENYYDTNVLAYLMMETLKAIKWNSNRFELRYIKDKTDNSFIMLFIIDESKVLNYSYGEIVMLDDIKANIHTMIRYNSKLEEI